MSQKKADETFSVTVTGAGVDINREVPSSRLALVMSVVMGSESPEGPANSGLGDGRSTVPEKVSLREFVDVVKATTKSDQIVTIGQYMAVHEGRDTFSRDDVKARFQAARERLPSNFPRDFNAAISKGMIAEDHERRGVFYITKTGAQAVERRFGAPD